MFSNFNVGVFRQRTDCVKNNSCYKCIKYSKTILLTFYGVHFSQKKKKKIVVITV